MVEKTRLKRKREVRKQRGGYFDKKTNVEKVAKELVEAGELDTYYFNKLKDEGIKHGLEEVELFKNRAKPQEIDESKLNERLEIEMMENGKIANKKLALPDSPVFEKVSNPPTLDDRYVLGKPRSESTSESTPKKTRKWRTYAEKKAAKEDKAKIKEQQRIDLQRQQIKKIQEDVDDQNKKLNILINKQLGLNKKGSKKYKKKKSKRKSKKSKRKPRKSKRKHKKKSKKTKRK